MEKNYNNGCDCNTKHIQGIKCNVQNCYYHDGECYCTAKEIAVGPRDALCSGDTLCVTFKPGENC